MAMKIFTHELRIRTAEHDQMLDITGEVNAAIAESEVAEGIVVVYVPHTTAAVTVNENADPDVVHDMLEALDKAAPWRQGFYRHGEGNSAAHVKSSMMGCSQTLLVRGGRIELGTWQSIWFCEFDGPRSRRATVQVMGR